ncbi:MULTISPECIES: hypothetical protein [unclassified Dehalobacter]|uniref:hypothetical protein n=1 Tax=unclassified Dehalobacter TaxID=2635733 RepID=UPI0002E90FE9|nr:MULTISPECIES: hypothetical protein [unclassified Dehalobacter]
MKIPLIALILQGIPENIALFTLSYAIAGLNFNWKRIVPLGIIMAFCSYLIRYLLQLLSFPFGIHTVLVIVLLFLILLLFCKASYSSAIIASLISTLIVIIGETLFLSILMPMFQITSEILNTNMVVRVLIGYPQVLLLFLVAFIVYKVRKRKSLQVL